MQCLKQWRVKRRGISSRPRPKGNTQPQLPARATLFQEPLKVLNLSWLSHPLRICSTKKYKNSS